MRSISVACTLLLSLAICSCGGNTPVDPEKSGETAPEEANYFNTDTLEGLYTGKLNDKTLTLNIFYAKDGRATGYNVVSGNRRNLSGSYTIDREGVKLVLTEPGDDKNDGVFNLRMNRNDQSVVSGEWTSNSGEVKTVFVKRLGKGENGLKGDYSGGYAPVFSDSVITVTFEEGGSCNYEYYQNKGEANEQAVTVDGTYESDGKTIVINWAKADMLSRKSVFSIVRKEVAYEDGDEKIYQHTLEGMGRTLDEQVMP